MLPFLFGGVNVEITVEYIEKMLREGKEVIFQEEREKRRLQKFTELFRELQARSRANDEGDNENV